jgi:hypothetical protein
MDEKPKSDHAAAPETRASSDVVLVHGVSDDGKSLAVLRARNNTLEAGVVRALGEGEPLDGEILKLTPRPECPVVCDVEVTVPRGALTAKGGSDGRPDTRAMQHAEPRRTGPAQVATPRYRDNWDAIWQRKPTKADRPN